MAADLHIHVATWAVTEEVLARFFSNVLGSKWHEAVPYSEHEKHWREDHTIVVNETPEVWVGEVSWLKAALFGDSESYIPGTVQAVNDIIGEDLPVVDDEMIEKIRQAFDRPNNTAKPDGVWEGRGYHLANVEDVVAFLEAHKGKKVFTVSW